MDEQNDKTLPNSLPPSYATLHEKAFHGDVTEAEKQGITSSDATFKRTSAVIAKRVEKDAGLQRAKDPLSSKAKYTIARIWEAQRGIGGRNNRIIENNRM